MSRRKPKPAPKTRARKPAGPKLPAAVTLQPQHAEAGAHLQQLIDAANVLMPFLAATLQQTQASFWQTLRDTHGIDTDTYQWELKGGKLVASVKPVPQGNPLAAGLPGA